MCVCERERERKREKERERNKYVKTTTAASSWYISNVGSLQTVRVCVRERERERKRERVRERERERERECTFLTLVVYKLVSVPRTGRQPWQGLRCQQLFEFPLSLSPSPINLSLSFYVCLSLSLSLSHTAIQSCVPRPRRRIYAAIVTEPGGILLAHTKMDANFKKNKQTNRQTDK